MFNNYLANMKKIFILTLYLLSINGSAWAQKISDISLGDNLRDSIIKISTDTNLIINRLSVQQGGALYRVNMEYIEKHSESKNFIQFEVYGLYEEENKYKQQLATNADTFKIPESVLQRKILGISRSTKYREMKQPRADLFFKEMFKNYGQPALKYDSYYIWTNGGSGKLSHDSCSEEYNPDATTQKKLSDLCGKSLSLKVGDGQDGFIYEYSANLVDHNSLVEVHRRYNLASKEFERQKTNNVISNAPKPSF